MTANPLRPMKTAMLVAQRIVADINDRGNVVGDRLPPERLMLEKYDVGRGTIRTALAQLTIEGLVEATRGSGRRVRRFERYVWPLSSYESGRVTIPDSDPWAAEVRRQGREPSETVRVSHEYVPDDIADLLDVAAGTRVVVRHRMRFVDGRPVQMSDSYFREDLAEGTPLLDPKPVHVAQGILAQIGRPQRRVSIRVSWGIARDDQREPFGDWVAGVPAAVIVHVGYGTDDEVLRVMRTIAPGDRNEITFELDLEHHRP
jgi:GntR family transcriptional regulator